MKRLAAMLPLLLLTAQAQKGPGPVLVPDVSQRTVRIVYSFTGADLLLFGAIVRPDGRTPAGEPVDIVVVVKGPTESVLVREKERVAGIWVNAGRLRYRSAPTFYAIASSKPIERLVDARTRAIYELGLDSLQLSPASSAASDEQARFQDGLVALKRRAGLYYADDHAVEITAGVLYRARVAIPARVPVGRFTAETFLIQNGAGAGRGGAADRHPEGRIRTLRRARGRQGRGALWIDGGGVVGSARLGGRLGRAAALDCDEASGQRAGTKARDAVA